MTRCRRAELTEVPERLALEATGRDPSPADVQREICGRAGELRAGSVGPVDVGRVQAASLDVGAEVRVCAAFGEVVEDGADGCVGCASRLTERRGDVE